MRSVYRRDDLAGALPLGEAQPLGLPHEVYKLAFTPGLIASVYRRESDGVVTDLLPDPTAVLAGEGGYLPGDDHRAAGLFPADDPDGLWWVPSGRLHYSPGASDTRPPSWHTPWRTSSSPAGSSTRSVTSTTISYDDYDLLTVQ